MEDNVLNITRDERVVILTISRPKAMNALNDAVMEALDDFFSEEPEPDIAGVILTGEGDKAFAAGADISEFPEMDREEGEHLARRGHRIFDMIEEYPRPVVAAVNGFALGGGCELAMACHLRVAVENARFGQPELKLGLIPGYGGTQRLVRYLGRTRAMEYLLTTDMITAAQAQEWGLVNTVVEAEQLMEASREFIDKIASKAPLAVEKIIECVNAYGEDGFEREIESFGACFETEDMEEGVDAFLNKRSPNFKGQ